MFEGILERFRGSKTFAYSVSNVLRLGEYIECDPSTLSNWRVQRAYLRENAFI